MVPTVVQSTDYFSSEEVVNAMRAVENEVLASVPRLHKVSPYWVKTSK